MVAPAPTYTPTDQDIIDAFTAAGFASKDEMVNAVKVLQIVNAQIYANGVTATQFTSVATSALKLLLLNLQLTILQAQLSSTTTPIQQSIASTQNEINAIMQSIQGG